MSKLLAVLKSKEFRHWYLYGGLCILLFVIDIVTKWLAQSLCTIGTPIEVIPNFFYITLSHNVGVAFSLGDSLGVWGRVLNIVISLVMSGVIGYYWVKHDKEFKTGARICAAMLLAGAFGNLIDRAFYWEGTVGFNGVIDFAQFYLGGGPSAKQTVVNPFATFNFADACLTLGVILFILLILIDMVKNQKKDELSEDPRLKEEEKKDE